MGLKLLLKRGALLTAANWPVVAAQFVAQTVFQLLLAVPIIGAAILVAVLLGADLTAILQGSFRDIFTTIASALAAEPFALLLFLCTFAIVLVGGSVFMFLVKAGTVDVLVAAHRASGPIERESLLGLNLRSAAVFSVQRYFDGCRRLFPRFLRLGIALMGVYAISVAGYLLLVIAGYRVMRDSALIQWTFATAAMSIALVAWITLVNLVYLLLQVGVAVGNTSVRGALRSLGRFVRAEFAEVAGIFLVILALVVLATVAWAIAWSAVGLVAFVPLVGLAVLPLQLAALLLRGLIFEYLGLSALCAYVTLFSAFLERSAAALPVASSASGSAAGPSAAASVPSSGSPP